MSLFLALCFFGSMFFIVTAMIVFEYLDYKHVRRTKRTYKETHDALLQVIDSMKQREARAEAYSANRNQQQ
jgi:CHASE3 domain sensor protein